VSRLDGRPDTEEEAAEALFCMGQTSVVGEDLPIVALSEAESSMAALTGTGRGRDSREVWRVFGAEL